LREGWDLDPEIFTHPECQIRGHFETEYKSLKIKDGEKVIVKEQVERVKNLMRKKLHLPSIYEPKSIFIVHNEALSDKFNTHVRGMQNNARQSPHLFKKSTWKVEGSFEIKEWYVEKLNKMIDDVEWNEGKEVISLFIQKNN